MDGCHSKLVNVVSGVPQGSALGPLLFLLYTSEFFSILENKLISYTDDSTLMAAVPSPSAAIKAAIWWLLCHSYGSRVPEPWPRQSECVVWPFGMKLNASKTKTMIVSRSCTMHPDSPPLTIDGTVLKESDDHYILGVTFDKHLRSVSWAASRRMSWRVFHDRLLIGRYFCGSVLPVLEYCSAVWCLTADTQL